MTTCPTCEATIPCKNVETKETDDDRRPAWVTAVEALVLVVLIFVDVKQGEQILRALEIMG